MAWQQGGFGHAARVFGLAFHPHSPDVIASASEDETARVWARDSSGAWQQTSCCRGHTSEVLRVAWSPDGRLLASGSADHTVRFWAVSSSPTEHSYTGTELAVLSGHPEEVYAVHFLTDTPIGSSTQQQHQQQQLQQATHQLASSTLDSPAAAGTANGGSSSSASSSSSSSRLLLTASGESLYLWDLVAGQLLQQTAPLPVLKSGAAFAAAVAGHSRTAKQQQQQQQQPGSSGLPSSAQAGQSGLSGQNSSSTDNTENQETDDSEEGFEEPPPSYVFGVSVCPETNWAAATCSDGMLRLWDASRQALTEIAAVQAHAGQMGSTVSWLPHQPLCVSSISKAGQLVLQDVRLLGRPLLQQQLEGPVYDAVWMLAQPPATAASAAGAAAGAAGAAAAAGGSGVTELQLVVAGRDSRLRAYCLTATALQQGHLAGPQLLSTPDSYSGSVLAVAATADGRRLAAAGEAVEADTLQPAQQQRQQQQQQVQQELPRVAARRGSAAARRGRSKAAAGLDLLSMSDTDADGAGSSQALFSRPQATASGHSGAANCAAAAAGVLTRAPLFVYSV